VVVVVVRRFPLSVNEHITHEFDCVAEDGIILNELNGIKVYRGAESTT
jgi:hypothetical protein